MPDADRKSSYIPVHPAAPPASNVVTLLRAAVPGPVRFSHAERAALIAFEYRFRVGLEFFHCDEGDEGAAVVSEANDRSVATILPTREGVSISDARFAPLGTFRTPDAASEALADYLDRMRIAERHVCSDRNGCRSARFVPD